MIKTTSFKPGRIYSVVYVNDVEMVGKREFFNPSPIISKLHHKDGKILNPLIDIHVTVRRVATIQAAGNATWANVQTRDNPGWQRTDRKSWFHTDMDNDCIIVHNTNGTRYLRGLPRGKTKEEYFIGGNPASQLEVEIITAFLKNNTKSEFVIIKLDNLENVLDNEALETMWSNHPAMQQ